MRARLLFLALLLVVGSAVGAESPQVPDEEPHATPTGPVYFVSPEEGEVVRGKPILRIGSSLPDLSKLRFRMVLTREGSAEPARTYDQRENPAAWWIHLDHEAPGVAFRPEEPVPDGAYLWKAAVWDGSTWTETKEPRRVVVDGSPPLPVEGVRIRRNPAKGTIFVDWDPVTTDRNGNPEEGLRYRLYRFEPRPFFNGLLLNEIALIEGTHWEDHDPKAIHGPTLYYVIRPVDLAGNEPPAEP